MNYYPDNRPDHFFTKLPQSIDLNDQYEVGLAEIQFTNSHFNVREDDVYFFYTTSKTDDDDEGSQQETYTVSLPAGLYESNKYFIHTLTKASETIPLMGDRKKRIRFYYNSATKKTSFTLYEHGAQITMSQTLKNILGFSKTIFYGSGSDSATRLMDLSQDFKSVFVYCDLVSPRPVGDVMVPLLRTLPPMDKTRETVHHVFEKPHYVPLTRFNFNALEIRLATDTGKEILFNNGHTIVTLHFRRSRVA